MVRENHALGPHTVRVQNNVQINVQTQEYI